MLILNALNKTFFERVKLVECPRDAMQGYTKLVPLELKIRYINALMKVGFDTLDCGSFVNPKLIPQMADTEEVINSINMTKTKLSVIVANVRGAEKAATFEQISYLGYPFSISETFQIRNTGSGIENALKTVGNIQDICLRSGKTLTVYISMGFGNPYNEKWSPELAGMYIQNLQTMGIEYFSLSDTVGISNTDNIVQLISFLNHSFKGLNYGCHFHTRPDSWKEKIEAAYNLGCRRFDGAIKGYGGCPMAEDELTGNMPTENMVDFFKEKGVATGIDENMLKEAMTIAAEIFG